MIVICPSCSTRYELSDAALANGRKVRCKQCRHIWHEEPRAPPRPDLAWDNEQEIAFVAPPEDEPAALGNTREENGAPIAGELGKAVGTLGTQNLNPEASLAPKPAVELENWKISWDLAGWMAVAGLAAILIGILFLGKDRIAGRWPAATHVYARIWIRAGSPSAGLELHNVNASFKDQSAKAAIMITGEVSNTTAATHPLVAIHIRFRDAKEKLLVSWSVRPKVATLPPQGMIPFQTELPGSPAIASTEVILGP